MNCLPGPNRRWRFLTLVTVDCRFLQSPICGGEIPRCGYGLPEDELLDLSHVTLPMCSGWCREGKVFDLNAPCSDDDVSHIELASYPFGPGRLEDCP